MTLAINLFHLQNIMISLCTAPSDKGSPYKQKFILGWDTWYFIPLLGYNKWINAKESEEAYLELLGLEQLTLSRE